MRRAAGSATLASYSNARQRAVISSRVRGWLNGRMPRAIAPSAAPASTASRSRKSSDAGQSSTRTFVAAGPPSGGPASAAGAAAAVAAAASDIAEDARTPDAAGFAPRSEAPAFYK